MHFFIQCERLGGGLQKLAEASVQLNDLNEKLAVQKVAVTEKTEACEKLLEEISKGTAHATERKSVAQEKQEEIAEQSVVIGHEKVRTGFMFVMFFNLEVIWWLY